MKKKYLATPFVIWGLLFTVIPLLFIFYYAFIRNVDGSVTFTLEFIMKGLEPLYLMVFWRSIVLAFKSTVVCLLVGYPAAYILSRLKSRSHIYMLLFVLPMWMNFLLRTYAWLSILERNGLLNTILKAIGMEPVNILYTEPAVILGMVYNFLPFMVIPILTVLKKMDKNLIEAAADLGANKWKTFTKVIYPLSIPGIVSGIAMVFMPAVTTFVVPSILGGGKVDLIGNVIERQFLQSNNWYFGSALSLLLMVVILFSMSIIRRYESEEGGNGLW